VWYSTIMYSHTYRTFEFCDNKTRYENPYIKIVDKMVKNKIIYSKVQVHSYSK